MKKARFILPVLAALLLAAGLTSCEPEYFGDSNTRVMQTTVYWNQWIDDGQTNYLYCELDWPALNTEVLTYGSITAYVYDGDYQNPLPYVIPITYTLASGATVVVPENIRYDLQPGKITFIMQDLDGNMPEGIVNSAPLTFRAVINMPVK